MQDILVCNTEGNDNGSTNVDNSKQKEIRIVYDAKPLQLTYERSR